MFESLHLNLLYPGWCWTRTSFPRKSLTGNRGWLWQVRGDQHVRYRTYASHGRMFCLGQFGGDAVVHHWHCEIEPGWCCGPGWWRQPHSKLQQWGAWTVAGHHFSMHLTFWGKLHFLRSACLGMQSIKPNIAANCIIWLINMIVHRLWARMGTTRLVGPCRSGCARFGFLNS